MPRKKPNRNDSSLNNNKSSAGSEIEKPIRVTRNNKSGLETL